MKQKVEIMSMTDEILSPITKASNVLLEDGSNVQQLIDNYVEPEFTPTIETSSLMSKVGQGDNVDFSANVINGAYESCVLKGKTLVNYNAEGNDRNEYVCMPSVEGQNVTVNDSTEGLVKSAVLKGRTLVNHFPSLTTGNFKKNTTTFEDGLVVFKQGSYLQAEAKNIKPSTVYTYILDIRSNTLDGQGELFQIIHNANGISATHQTITKEIGVIKIKFTTLSDLTNRVLELNTRSSATGGEIKIKSIMLLEGDYTNVDIPYFEGMSSVKMPVLKTTGKNLFDVNKYPFQEGMTYNYATGDKINGRSNMTTADMIPIKGGEKYSFNAFIEDLSVVGEASAFYFDKDKKYIGRNVIARNDKLAITPPTNASFVSFTLCSNNATFLNGDKFMLIESGTIPIVYEPYKSNTLTTPQDVVLRKVGDVEDTLDLATGELTQRIATRDYQAGDESNTQLITDMTTTCYILDNPITSKIDLNNQKVYSYNDTTHYTCSSAEDSLIPTLTIEEGVKYQAIIKPSTKYSIVFNRTVASDSLTVDLGGATASVVSTTTGKTIVQITTLPTLSHNYVKFLGVGNAIKDVQVIEGEVADDVEYFEGMIDVENPVVTNCNMLDVDSTDYQSNTISTNEVVLRSLPNGVCDTLDLMTGECVQHVGVREYQSGDESDSQVSTDKVNTRYELATPITTTIDLKQLPCAYKDGYISLSSNSEKSLTPTIEYSLPINRSGQVSINTQLVQKQQKQLDELESMIIANMVNTQYKQTLSNVEYMLGGE